MPFLELLKDVSPLIHTYKNHRAQKDVKSWHQECLRRQGNRWYLRVFVIRVGLFSVHCISRTEMLGCGSCWRRKHVKLKLFVNKILHSSRLSFSPSLLRQYGARWRYAASVMASPAAARCARAGTAYPTSAVSATSWSAATTVPCTPTSRTGSFAMATRRDVTARHLFPPRTSSTSCRPRTTVPPGQGQGTRPARRGASARDLTRRRGSKPVARRSAAAGRCARSVGWRCAGTWWRWWPGATASSTGAVLSSAKSARRWWTGITVRGDSSRNT